MPIDIDELAGRVGDFRLRIGAAREAAGPASFWYPYDTLSNIPLLAKLLKGENRSLLDASRSPFVADIGAGDGDVAFFLESTGCTVDVVDHAETNFNGLEGARRLAKELGSSVSIVDTDLDHSFVLPRPRYNLVLFLGILYHLKNPFNAMECLAEYSDHCIVSTRVAAWSGDRRTEIRSLPVAYLVGRTEANNDPTNFWIFSEAGLRRLFDRTGWTVKDWETFGDEESDPASTEHDQRVFCLLENKRRL